MTEYRQGDIYLRSALAPANAQWKLAPKRLVLAEGEVTGHAHVMEATDLDLCERDGVLYLRVASETLLRHEEHGSIAVAPDIYEVVRQAEWGDQDEPIQVAD